MTNCIYFKNHLNGSVSNLTDLVDISIICDKASTKKKNTTHIGIQLHAIIKRNLQRKSNLYVREI